MNKKVLALLACCLLVICCCSQGPRSHYSSTMNWTVKTQDELDQGNQRINQFREEFLTKGFRLASISSSDLKEQVVLKGDYGELKDVEVTLWTGKRLDAKDQLGGGVSAPIADEGAEREFKQLYSKVVSVVTGKP